MKKSYVKPELYAESFRLMEHISQGCGVIAQYGPSSSCKIVDEFLTFFTQDSCGDDMRIVWGNAGLNPNGVTHDNLGALGQACYNTAMNISQLYTS